MSQIRDRSRDNPRGTGHSSARGEALAMEIVARRDAFKSGFEVILFAPGCAKKEDSNDGGGRIRSEKKKKKNRARSSRSETRHVTHA